MARGRLKIAGADEYVSGKRANWLISARRARLLPNGELEILGGAVHGYDARNPSGIPDANAGQRAQWTPVSGNCVMNGAAINRANGE